MGSLLEGCFLQEYSFHRLLKKSTSPWFKSSWKDQHVIVQYQVFLLINMLNAHILQLVQLEIKDFDSKVTKKKGVFGLMVSFNDYLIVYIPHKGS